MTYQPPPPQPPGRPGAAAKSLNPLDLGILAAGVLALIFSSFDYYTASDGIVAISENAWHGFFGWFGILCALAGSARLAISLFAPSLRTCLRSGDGVSSRDRRSMS